MTDTEINPTATNRVFIDKDDFVPDYVKDTVGDDVLSNIPNKLESDSDVYISFRFKKGNKEDLIKNIREGGLSVGEIGIDTETKSILYKYIDKDTNLETVANLGVPGKSDMDLSRLLNMMNDKQYEYNTERYTENGLTLVNSLSDKDNSSFSFGTFDREHIYTSKQYYNKMNLPDPNIKEGFLVANKNGTVSTEDIISMFEDKNVQVVNGVVKLTQLSISNFSDTIRILIEKLVNFNKNKLNKQSVTLTSHDPFYITQEYNNKIVSFWSRDLSCDSYTLSDNYSIVLEPQRRCELSIDGETVTLSPNFVYVMMVVMNGDEREFTIIPMNSVTTINKATPSSYGITIFGNEEDYEKFDNNTVVSLNTFNMYFRLMKNEVYGRKLSLLSRILNIMSAHVFDYKLLEDDILILNYDSTKEDSNLKLLELLKRPHTIIDHRYQNRVIDEVSVPNFKFSYPSLEARDFPITVLHKTTFVRDFDYPEDLGIPFSLLSDDGRTINNDSPRYPSNVFHFMTSMEDKENIIVLDNALDDGMYYISFSNVFRSQDESEIDLKIKLSDPSDQLVTYHEWERNGIVTSLTNHEDGCIDVKLRNVDYNSILSLSKHGHVFEIVRIETDPTFYGYMNHLVHTGGDRLDDVNIKKNNLSDLRKGYLMCQIDMDMKDHEIECTVNIDNNLIFTKDFDTSTTFEEIMDVLNKCIMIYKPDNHHHNNRFCKYIVSDEITHIFVADNIDEDEIVNTYAYNNELEDEDAYMLRPVRQNDLICDDDKLFNRLSNVFKGHDGIWASFTITKNLEGGDHIKYMNIETCDDLFPSNLFKSTLMTFKTFTDEFSTFSIGGFFEVYVEVKKIDDNNLHFTYAMKSQYTEMLLFECNVIVNEPSSNNVDNCLEEIIHQLPYMVKLSNPEIIIGD